MVSSLSSSSSESSSLAGDGFVYEEEAIGVDTEQRLIAHIERELTLPLGENDLVGVSAEDREHALRYGWSYSTNPKRLREIPSWVPDFWPAPSMGIYRACAINVYLPSQGIVRHADLKVFDGPIGVLSLGSQATLMFERLSLGGMVRVPETIARRSFYTIDGVMRSQWFHSIEPVAAKRYSVVYRTRRS